MADTRKLSGITWFALALAIIGTLNWGLVGLFNVDLVKALFGPMTTVSRIVYTLVGLSGIYLLVDAFRLKEERRGPVLERTARRTV